MMEIVDRLLSLIQEGTAKVVVPIIVLCFFMFVLIVERSASYFGSPLSMLWAPARRRLREREERVTAALDAYIEDPRPETRAKLTDASLALPTPYGRFFLRVFSGGAYGDASVRDLHLAESRLGMGLEIDQNLGLVSVTAKAAPLFGLLGTVTGMIHTFKAMMLASTSDPRALSAGISMALIATEVGLLVGLPGVVGMSWLSRRAQDLEAEIGLASMRLAQVGPEAGPGEAEEGA